ncbi:MAG TPA: ABC transporter permease [Acidimicrobiales bacterium]|nr:ABC transporter permease [Acidimicrobiales bacterium]
MSAAIVTADVAGSSARRGRIGTLARRSDTALIGLIVIITLVATATLSDFRTLSNINNLLNTTALIAIVAVGEAVVILARQIDLSVGAIVGICAYLVGEWSGHVSGPFGPVVGVLLALGLGAAFGLGNALLVNVFKMPAIIATLATLSIYTGLQIIVNNGSQLYLTQVPKWLAGLRGNAWFGIGTFIWIAVIVLVAVSFILRRTRFGRDIYALGSNPEAAVYLGVKIRLRTYQIFALCGALAGLGGLMYTSQFGNVDATAGSGMNLTVIAAAVVGGVSLFGGAGTALSAVLGALLLGEIQNVLELTRISIFAEQTLQGAAIVIAVAVYAVVSRRLRRPVRREAFLSEHPTLDPAAINAAGGAANG